MGKKKGWGNKSKGTMHRKSTASKTSPTANLAASPPADAADEEEGEDAAAPSPTPPVVVDHEVGEREEAEAPMPALFVWCPPLPPFVIDALIDAALDICVEHVFNYEVVSALAHDTCISTRHMRREMSALELLDEQWRATASDDVVSNAKSHSRASSRALRAA